MHTMIIKIHSIALISFFMTLQCSHGEFDILVTTTNFAKTHLLFALPFCERLQDIDGYNVTLAGEHISSSPHPGSTKVPNRGYMSHNLEFFKLLEDSVPNFWMPDPPLTPLIDLILLSMTAEGINLAVKDNQTDSHLRLFNADWDLLLVDSVAAPGFLAGVTQSFSRFFNQECHYGQLEIITILWQVVIDFGYDSVSFGSDQAIALNPQFGSGFYARLLGTIGILKTHLSVLVANLVWSNRFASIGYNDTPTRMNIMGQFEAMFFVTPVTIRFPTARTHNMVDLHPPLKSITYNALQLFETQNAQLTQFINSPKSLGTILICFGTNVKWSLAPQATIDNFITMCAHFDKYHFVWVNDVFGLDIDHRLSDNVWLTKWIDQPALLFHSQTVAFVSHGGYSSVSEAIAAAVPMLIMPFLADHHYHALLFTHHGNALSLPKTEHNTTILIDKLNSIITDQKYRQNAKRIRDIYSDNIAAPDQQALHLIKRIRHKKRAVEKPRSVHLPRWTRDYWDFCVLVIVLSFFT